ncbi:cytochrome c maturation protein CcmE [Brevibacillus ginsengisoli]|uniref:cytochrome c maturation protein CcmE n=1 Tax=Brevibacillus ginsengisoli TaxID=363854 RepID=UPI003CF2A4CB
MNKNKKVYVGGIIIAASIVSLLIAATPGASGAEATVSQLVSNPSKYSGSYVTTQGNLIAKSIKWNADKIELQFDIQDEQGNKFHVTHHGVKPDNFTDQIIVVVDGTMTTDGQFTAEHVKTRCPSKYEGQDPKSYDPELHKKLNQSQSSGK